MSGYAYGCVDGVGRQASECVGALADSGCVQVRVDGCMGG